MNRVSLSRARVQRWLVLAVLAAGVVLVGLVGRGTSAVPVTMVSSRTYAKPADDQLRKTLSALQYAVTQRGATEPPFANAFWNNHQAGLYVDVVTGEPLFSSQDKFDSGTGWPSFTRPVEPQRVVERQDTSAGMTRTEVRSRGGGSHLGHVFADGPPPTGLRYCINSAALRFVPADKLEAEGYGPYVSKVGTLRGSPRPLATDSAQQSPAVSARPLVGLPPSAPGTETAVLAGGCFWGMEEILRKIPGVIATEVGYTGGATARPTYEDVHTGATGHAEAVRIIFDPTKLSYADLLEKWFFRMHDPTTPNRQGNDVGTQYRSAIFVTSAAQRRIAEEVMKRVAQGGRWKRPLVTQIADAGPFWRAEDYHQRYLEKNPGGYTCHYLRD